MVDMSLMIEETDNCMLSQRHWSFDQIMHTCIDVSGIQVVMLVPKNSHAGWSCPVECPWTKDG